MNYDVLIVGGGPVGASLARAAQGFSAKVLVPERRAAPPRSHGTFDARVYALSPANVAFLGLEEGSLTPVHAMRVYGDRGSCIEFEAYRAGVAALAYIVEHSFLEETLWTGLEPEVGRCTGLATEDRYAALRLDDGRELCAALVVGADGAESRVRGYAGIAAQSKPYGQSAVVANFACEHPHSNTAYQWFQGGPVLALLPLPGNHVSMVWSLPEAQAGHILSLNELELSAQVREATGAALGALSVVTPPRAYPLRRLSARRMIAPRVALAGDAAHVIHPLAGQGLNLGLQDVRTLSRVITEREPVRDAGDWRVLRRYERARAEPILAMDAVVDGLYRLFSAQAGAAAALRNRGLNLTNRMQVVKNLLIRQAMS